MIRNTPQETLPTEQGEILDTNTNLRLQTQMSVSESAGTDRADFLLTRRERMTKIVRKSTKSFFRTMIFNYCIVIYLKLVAFLMLIEPFSFELCVIGLAVLEFISIVVSFQGVKSQREVTSKKTLVRALTKNAAFVDIFSRLLCYVLFFVFRMFLESVFIYTFIPFYINCVYQIIRIFVKGNKVSSFFDNFANLWYQDGGGGIHVGYYHHTEDILVHTDLHNLSQGRWQNGQRVGPHFLAFLDHIQPDDRHQLHAYFGVCGEDMLVLLH